MANKSHLAILKTGVRAWNEWRWNGRSAFGERGSADSWFPDLSGTDLHGMNLAGVAFFETDLSRSNLASADLSGADLRGRLRSHRNGRLHPLEVISEAGIRRTELDSCKNEFAVWMLDRPDLLREADLSGARLDHANLCHAGLQQADLSNAILGDTIFGGTDLTGAHGLDSCIHLRACTIDHETILRSGLVPIAFLRGCGLPERLISDFTGQYMDTKNLDSCFISYSHCDKDFASLLHGALQGRGVRCWLDEKQLLPGEDIYDAVDQGIRMRDKVLLCCSERSLTSWWVDSEIGTALEKEKHLSTKHGKMVRVIIPLNLDGYLFSEAWKSGYRAQIRRRFAADFTTWRTDLLKFERTADELIRALQADA